MVSTFEKVTFGSQFIQVAWVVKDIKNAERFFRAYTIECRKL